MNRPLGRPILGLCLAIAATATMAQTVYQWKDAQGITHYSDAPPPKGAQRRELHTKAGTPAKTATPATTAVADNADCAQARLNLMRLQGNTEVGLDADRDGKIDAPMAAEERARQVERMRDAIKSVCPGGQ